MAALNDMDRSMTDIAADLGLPLHVEDGAEFIAIPLDELNQLVLARRPGEFAIRVQHDWWETIRRGIVTSSFASAAVGFCTPNAAADMARGLKAMHEAGIPIPHLLTRQADDAIDAVSLGYLRATKPTTSEETPCP